MEIRCTSCRSGPTGIEGHDGLFAYRMAGSRMQFKCRECDSLWTRSYKGEGGLDWSASLDELPGWEAPGYKDQ